MLSVAVGYGHAYGDVSRLYPLACTDVGSVFHAVVGSNLLHHYGRGDVDALHSRSFGHYGDHIIDCPVAFIHDFKNHFTAFAGGDDVVAVIVDEAYVAYLQVVEDRRGGIGFGLRLFIGFRPFYPVTVLLLLRCGNGISNGGSRNGSDNCAYGRSAVAASPATVAVTYQAADGAAHISADGCSGKYGTGIA